jgi:glycosyltransferase involved in cell wall biosynthesis
VFDGQGKVNLGVIGQVRNFILEQNIHIVHTHGYKQDFIGLLAATGTPCKLISTPHGWSKQADFKLRCYEILDRCVFPFFDVVAPLSEELLKPLRRLPFMKTKLCLIRNAVDLDDVVLARDVAPEIHAWRQRGATVIGYMGRLDPAKGVEVLLRALLFLRNQKVHLVVVGEGDDRNRLESLSKNLKLSEKVSFVGYQEDRFSYLKGFSAFVLPSFSEGTPRCLMEAMGAEVPIIASDIEGCRVLIEHGRTGLLFPCGNSEALATAIDETLEDPDLARSRATKAREFVEDSFSAKRMALEYQALYERLTRKGLSSEREVAVCSEERSEPPSERSEPTHSVCQSSRSQRVRGQGQTGGQHLHPGVNIV